MSTSWLNCLEMISSDLDMIVLSHLNSHRRIEEITETSSDSTSVEAQLKHRVAVDYFFQGKCVCKSTYLFVHAIGPKRYKNLVRHYEKHGLVPRVHGNVKPLPSNTVALDKTKSIVQFISNFATIHCLDASLVSLVMKKQCCFRHTCQKGIFIGNTKRNLPTYL